MKEYDVAVVGGGPIGGHVAYRIAEKNYKVGIFEKRKNIGTPINCAGLVTPRVFEFLKINEKNIVQNKIKGAKIHSPSGTVLKIGGDRVHAYAIDRKGFDQEIVKKAEDKGAEVTLNSNILSAQKNGNSIELRNSKGEDIKCHILVGADGPFSKIRDRFALSEPEEFLRGIGAEVKNTNLDSDFVEIFAGEKIAPGFFAWIIPTNKEGTEARIGLCIDKSAKNSPKYYFSNFLKNQDVQNYCKDVKIINYIGGIVPLGILKKTYSSNVMIVGDAAAQVKPTSGGGIYTGLVCADHCSDVIIESIKGKNYSSQLLKRYQRLWYAEIGREINLGMKFRKIFKSLSDEQIDKYIKRFQNPKIVEIISKYGDIDKPSKLIKPLLKKSPTLLKLIPSVLKE